MKPEEIESLSFKIIEEEAGRHSFDNKQWQILRRIIHTSADFEYIDTVKFSPDAVEKALKTIKKGCPIFTDTNMARAGIRKKETGLFNCTVECLIADDDVARRAKENGTTRAVAAVDTACEKMKGGIYVIGNAPTALLRLIELTAVKKAEPDLIIGFPVGFVNAAESKAELMKQSIPFITNSGRKGGSNIAASVVNALLIMASQTGPAQAEAI